MTRRRRRSRVTSKLVKPLAEVAAALRLDPRTRRALDDLRRALEAPGAQLAELRQLAEQLTPARSRSPIADLDRVRRQLAETFAPLLEEARRFDRELAAAVTRYPAIDPDRVRAILVPADADGLIHVLWLLRDLPVIETLLARYRDDLAIAKTLHDDGAEAARLTAGLAALTDRRAQIVTRAAAAKLDGPARWGTVDWDASLREFAHDRRFRPERLPVVGDRIAALAAYLGPCVDTRRRTRPRGPGLYKAAVLELVATLTTAAYVVEFPMWRTRPLTAAGVKALIISRHARP